MMKKGRRRSLGQVIVEVILILPLFLAIVFTILEMGNIAYNLIIIQHATWETARYGAMTAVPAGGKTGPNVSKAKLQTFLQRIVPAATVKAAFPDMTIADPQAGVNCYDLVLTTEYPIPLIFPISNLALSKPPGAGKRTVEITLRMPIEQPLLK
ncbi:MAG: pilus assembly protein [Elusimicrobia bacterium]|nr:pilus assembly protein [Elusimicrobiota bacterium]